MRLPVSSSETNWALKWWNSRTELNRCSSAVLDYRRVWILLFDYRFCGPGIGARIGASGCVQLCSCEVIQPFYFVCCILSGYWKHRCGRWPMKINGVWSILVIYLLYIRGCYFVCFETKSKSVFWCVLYQQIIKPHIFYNMHAFQNSSVEFKEMIVWNLLWLCALVMVVGQCKVAARGGRASTNNSINKHERRKKRKWIIIALFWIWDLVSRAQSL